MYGALDFYNSCKSNNVKPIIGCEMYVAKISRRRKHTKVNGYNHLTLLAKNNIGIKNLFYLSSMSFIEGLSVRPRIDAEILYNNSEGIICLSGCLSGLINDFLRNDDYPAALNQLGTFRDIFGSENTYVEIQRNGIDIQEKCNEGLVKLGKDLNIPVVATNDIHFSRRESCDFHDTLICVSMGAKKNDLQRFRFDTDDVYIKSQDEMVYTFRDLPDSVFRTLEIEEKINTELKQGVPIFPEFDCEGQAPIEYLRRLVGQGIRERFKNPTEEEKEKITNRAEYELSVIEEMGFAEYFLSVKDYIDYAKQAKIPFGPGRGSAAGSLISYCLHITKVDPLKHGLIFERFINPSRKDFPDIDTDFCKESRDQMIEYLEEKHGADKVARILTVGRFGAKSALRRACTVYDLPLNESDVMAKRLSDDTSIEDSIKQDDLLKQDAANHPKIFEAAIELQQFVSNVGVHASGVVVSKNPLVEILPLARSKDGYITTQWDGHGCEKAGLIKFDLLALQTLTTISICLKLIKERHGIDINVEEIPFDDPKIFELYQKGDTEGIFQCYSDGMQDLMLKMKPDHFDHIAAALALYRPGPINSGITKSFYKRKDGKEDISYIHEDAEKHLKETYGLMVYQEQIMQLSQSLAGFTLAEADDLRKTIGKKKQKELNAIGSRWNEGIKKLGKLTREQGISLWEDIQKFGEYGFNKCLTSETEILTEHGSVRIEDIKIGSKVLTIDNSQNIVESSVVNLYNNGNKPVYEYTFDDGSIVRCTQDHKFLTEYGQKSINEIQVNNMCVWSYSSEENRSLALRRVVSRTYIGKCQTYDIEVDHPKHNFILSNGLCTSNSHSVSYAYISIWTAYLKVYYPTEFYCANMTIEGNAADLDKLRSFIYDARIHGIEIAPPDLRDCSWDFKIESDTVIRMGLAGVKGVGREAGEAYENRKLDKSKDWSIVDLFKDFDGKIARKNIIEPLIKSGAIDFVEKDRGVLYNAVPKIITKLRSWRDKQKLGKEAKLRPIEFNEEAIWDKQDRQINERDVYGFYLTEHPLKDKRLETILARHISIKEATLLESRRKDTHLVGVLVSINISTVKSGKNKGKKYARLLLEDEFSSIPVVAFPSKYSLIADSLREIHKSGEALIIEGNVDVSGKKNQLVLNDFRHLSGNLDISKGLIVPLSKDTSQEFVDTILAEADKYPGELPLSFKVFGRVGVPVIVTTNKFIDLNSKFQEFLFNIL